jgi:hypothetical protein
MTENFGYLIQAFSCWFMTGVIWLVQILIYPNFRLIEAHQFQSYHQFHISRITWVVAPIMGIELTSGVWLLWGHHQSIFFWNFVSIFGIWILTGFVSVPFHNLLHRKPEHSRNGLIWGNWPRTFLWSLRSLFWFWLILEKLSGASL